MCDLLLIWFLKRLILNLTKCHLVPNNHACASTQRITRRICNCRTLHFFIRKYQSFLSIHRAYHQPLKNHNQHISESCQKGRDHRAGSSLKLLKTWEFNLKSYVSMRIVNIWSSKWRNMHTLEEINNFQVQYWASSIFIQSIFMSKYFLPSIMGIFIFSFHGYTQVLPKEKESYLWMSRLSKMAAELSSYRKSE